MPVQKNVNKSFVNSISTIAENTARLFISEESTQAIYHTPTQVKIKFGDNFVISGRYASKNFLGTLPNTGAALCSTAGLNYTKAHLNEFNGKMVTTCAGEITAYHGAGSFTSEEAVLFTSPVAKFMFLVVETEVSRELNLAKVKI